MGNDEAWLTSWMDEGTSSGDSVVEELMGDEDRAPADETDDRLDEVALQSNQNVYEPETPSKH